MARRLSAFRRPQVDEPPPVGSSVVRETDGPPTRINRRKFDQLAMGCVFPLAMHPWRHLTAWRGGFCIRSCLKCSRLHGRLICGKKLQATRYWLASGFCLCTVWCAHPCEERWRWSVVFLVSQFFIYAKVKDWTAGWSRHSCLTAIF